MTGADGSPENLIPANVRFQAENMFAVMPEVPPGLPGELIRNDRYCLFVSPMPSVNFVDRVRVSADSLEATVAEVRELLRARGRRQAAWAIDSGATPPGLAARLSAFGLTPYDEPPLEPSAAAMAIVTPPVGSESPDVEAYEVCDHDDVDRFIDVEQGVVQLSRGDSAGARAAAHTLFDHRRIHGGPVRFYLATRTGVPVGAARAGFLQFGVNLSGSAVTPTARGHGVYRALIKARWNDAVAFGTPALTVQAGAMSRPILAKLGFVTVAHITILRDRFR